MAEGAESVRILEKLGKAALCALLMLALLGAAAGAETLRVGVRDDIINFGFYNETTGKYYGLEIDLAAELARRIGCDGVEYITVTPDTRKDMLLNGEVDVVIATYCIAESREENFDFSAPYYEDDTIIMVEKSTLFGSIRDLKDKNIGIVNGTNAGPLLAQKLYDEGIITDVVVENTDTFTQYEGAYVTKTERYADLDALLETGEIDAVCMDACIAQTYMNDQRMFLDVSIAHQEYGVATVKDSALSAPVAEAVQAMLDDGTIDRLIDKWNQEGGASVTARLKRKAAIMIVVELIFLSLVGVLLTNMQTDLSLNDQRDNIAEKLEEMDELVAAADASGVEMKAPYSSLYSTGNGRMASTSSPSPVACSSSAWPASSP